MNRVALHQLLACHELQISQSDVLFVSVFENHRMARGNRTVFLFPNAYVLPLPSEPAESRARGFRDLSLVVAIGMTAVHAHQSSNRHRGMRHLAFFELRLPHAAAADGVARTMQSFVRGNMAFRKALRDSKGMLRINPAHAAHGFRVLPHSEICGAAVN